MWADSSFSPTLDNSPQIPILAIKQYRGGIMKRALVLSVILMVGIVGVAQAGHGNVGIGIQLGEPTGLTGKFWIGSVDALDLTIGWNFISEWIAVQGGYLYHFPLIVRTGDLYAYVGAGARLDAWSSVGGDDNFRLAGRIPVGIEYIYHPISFYGELDPLVRLYPALDFDLGGGLGFRFYF
jgi:hypothetical protein